MPSQPKTSLSLPPTQYSCSRPPLSRYTAGYLNTQSAVGSDRENVSSSCGISDNLHSITSLDFFSSSSLILLSVPYLFITPSRFLTEADEQLHSFMYFRDPAWRDKGPRHVTPRHVTAVPGSRLNPSAIRQVCLEA